MVIWNDLVWAKRGGDLSALRPSAGSDCLWMNAVVAVQVSSYQSLDAQNTKQTKIFVTTSFVLQRLIL